VDGSSVLVMAAFMTGLLAVAALLTAVVRSGR
jgi:hypothetical protein